MKSHKSQSQVAVVTGGSRRLGRQISLALSKHGYDVVINYHQSRGTAEKTVKNIKQQGQNAIAIKADVSKRRDVHRMVKKVIATFGKIDLLVNNAAVFIQSPFSSTSDAIWDKTININLKGTFLCSQLLSRYMLKQKSGHIINIASLGGIQAWTQHVPYSVSKAGVIMLTKILAKSLAPYVSVNAIAPGVIIMEGEEDRSIKHIGKNFIPLMHYGKPSDITDMVIYLATQSRYITGQIYSVDGGRSIQ